MNVTFPARQHVNDCCRDGAFGTVRVQYSTYAVDTVEEATADGSSVLDYYISPLAGTPLPLAAQSGTSWDVTTQNNPLLVSTECTSHVEICIAYPLNCPIVSWFCSLLSY